MHAQQEVARYKPEKAIYHIPLLIGKRHATAVNDVIACEPVSSGWRLSIIDRRFFWNHIKQLKKVIH